MERKEMEDDRGNIIVVGNSGDIVLWLKSEKKPRNIGKIYPNGIFLRTIYNENQIYHKLNAFGFNHQAIEAVQPKHIMIMYKKVKYVLSKEEYDKHKIFLEFSKIGFEKQVFVRIEDFAVQP